MSGKDARRIAPMMDNFNEPFWSAAREGRLVVQRSKSTGAYQWPPRPRLLPDWDDDMEWTEVPGNGTVYSFSVVYRSSHTYPPTPYVIAVIELDCGVFFTSNIVDVDPEKVRIGMKVKVALEPQDEKISLPVFSPRN